MVLQEVGLSSLPRRPLWQPDINMTIPRYLHADLHTHPLGDKYYYHPSRQLSSADRDAISRFLYSFCSSGLHLLACTDHHSVASGQWAKEEASRRGYPFTVIPGAEVVVLGASQRLHLLALNISADLAVSRLTLKEAAAQIRRQGGVAVLAHPVKYPQELKKNPELLISLDGIERVNLSEGIFEADRYLNGNSCYQNRYIQQTGGSDFHWNPDESGASPASIYRKEFPFHAPVRWLLEKGLLSNAELERMVV